MDEAELEVDPGVLAAAALAHEVARGRVLRVEASRQRALPPPGALGRILPAAEIEEELATASELTRQGLGDLARLLGETAELVWLLERLFTATDDRVAERLDLLRGRR